MRVTVFWERKDAEKKRFVYVVAGYKFVFLADHVFLDGEKLVLDELDFFEADVVAVKATQKQEGPKEYYKEVHLYTAGFFAARNIVEQLTERFGEEKEMAIRVKEVNKE
ncbi:hypothetical protein [Thermofilum sp.]|jgi:hypothetical protein|uniref:hypothetical protein n=1 Tax=Thermofilum sp. TaxID=1961369 RepID=UPI002588E824|nr:hypothetical protein [Thermofilum sp.]